MILLTMRQLNGQLIGTGNYYAEFAREQVAGIEVKRGAQFIRWRFWTLLVAMLLVTLALPSPLFDYWIKLVGSNLHNNVAGALNEAYRQLPFVSHTAILMDPVPTVTIQDFVAASLYVLAITLAVYILYLVSLRRTAALTIQMRHGTGQLVLRPHSGRSLAVHYEADLVGIASMQLGSGVTAFVEQFHQWNQT